MPFKDFILSLTGEQKRLIRSLEHLYKKLIKANFAVIFNETCLNENKLPIYTNVKPHDPAVRQQPFLKVFRKRLVEHQIETKKNVIKELDEEIRGLEAKLSETNMVSEVRQEVHDHLAATRSNNQHLNKIKTCKKLSRLHGGQVTVPDRKDTFINLSKTVLTESQKEFLNLGLKCHYVSRNDAIEKKTSIEILYEDIERLEKEGKVTVNQALRDRLIGESAKLRGNGQSKLLTEELRQAAKELRENGDIVIRRADKTSSYVILDTDTYLKKMEDLLGDVSKFEKLKRDPTDALKVKTNKIIDSANAVVGDVHFSKITGEYNAGYAYGNVKVHKKDNPLRPIIAQVTTPTYRLAKRLNSLLSPYMPTQHSLKSSEELIDLLRNRDVNGVLASLDVESLFTNVPVEATINIILDNVYSGNILPPLKISRNVLEKLLRVCTLESPFRGPDGTLYRQKDGVAMGSPLGPLFANFYMCHIENQVLQQRDIRPDLYVRYVDDILVCVRDEDQLKALKEAFEEQSVLRFTYELSNHNKIAFLDVWIEAEGGKCVTSVHRKPTDEGNCLNARSECPERYKSSVIKSFVRRALTHCSTWENVSAELTRTRQVLINNGYSNRQVDAEIKAQMDKMHDNKATDKKEKINLFYRSQMNSSYQLEERIMRDIITSHVESTDPDKQLNLVIYYNTAKTSGLVLQNNMHAKRQRQKQNGHLQRTNVIYRYNCPEVGCRRLQTDKYIGATTTTLSRRLTMHLQEGAIKKHAKQHHKRDITRQDLITNTDILEICNDHRRIWVAEALYIREFSPFINIQSQSAVTLSLWK